MKTKMPRYLYVKREVSGKEYYFIATEKIKNTYIEAANVLGAPEIIGCYELQNIYEVTAKMEIIPGGREMKCHKCKIP